MINELNAAITTSKPRINLQEIAEAISQEIKIPFIPRNNISIVKLKEKFNIRHLLIVREDKLQVSSDNNDFFFHPGMSLLRIKELIRGKVDPMIQAMNLKEGDHVLDCTLGLANDAIVASFITGETGSVTGLESSSFIYIITKIGLETYNQGNKIARKAMKKIHVKWTDYNIELTKFKDNSFDVVYFDPMFKQPVNKSSGIQGLRTLANYQGLTEKILIDALRIARKRVVFKERTHSSILQQFTLDEIIGGKHSSIAYGILHKR